MIKLITFFLIMHFTHTSYGVHEIKTIKTQQIIENHKLDDKTIVTALHKILQNSFEVYNEEEIYMLLFQASNYDYWNEIVAVLDQYYDTIDINYQNMEGENTTNEIRSP